jgi:deoxyuridine 5'-triphosphate nucleotidohydrolase
MDKYNIESFDMDNSESLTVESQTYETPSFRYVSRGADLTQGSTNAAGLDLHVYSIDNDFIGTGIQAAIPTGWVGLVVPRSSLGLKGFRLKNTLGVIDSDYRGEIKLAYEGYRPEPGDRVAQLVLLPHYVGAVERMASIDDLDQTERGDGGFGSSGDK